MNDGEHKIFVWDMPTRVFHWTTAVLVAAAYVTWRLDLMDWHARIGDAVLALVIFRLLWGFFGSETARFRRFLAAPAAAIAHLAGLFRREGDHAAGHNPAGGYMVVILLALLLGETLSGLFVLNDVADEGPFTELAPAAVANAVTAMHWIFWDALLAAVALHILAILVYAVVKGQNLVAPMLSGWKTLPQTVKQPRRAGLWRAGLLFACSAIAAAAAANFL